MHNIKIKELSHKGILKFIHEPKIFGFNWVDSYVEESEQFDEENQCMKEKTRHKYIIFGIEELFEISFYSEFFVGKDEFIERLNNGFMNGVVYEYDEKTGEYHQPEY